MNLALVMECGGHQPRWEHRCIVTGLWLSVTHPTASCILRIRAQPRSTVRMRIMQLHRSGPKRISLMQVLVVGEAENDDPTLSSSLGLDSVLQTLSSVQPCDRPLANEK